MSYENLLIAGGASTISNSVVWLAAPTPEEEIVAFLCSNHVQIYERRSKRVELTLKAQEERLDCIAGLYSLTDKQYVIVTGSAKGTVNVWMGVKGDNGLEWTLRQSIMLPSGAAVSCIEISNISNSNTKFVAAGDAKGQVHVFRLLSSSQEFELYQKLSFPSSQLPKVLKFSQFANNVLALAVGGVDAKLHLYVHDIDTLMQSIDAADAKFRGVGNLWGHEEWITCLDEVSLTLPSDSQQSVSSAQEVTFLASGSQDNKIRIWKIVAKPLTAAIATALGLDDTNEKIDGNTNQLNENAEDEDDDDDDIIEGEEGGNSGGAKASSGTSNRAIDSEDIQDAEARLTFTNVSRTMVYQVFLESLLIGHEDWVTSLAWMPIKPSSSSHQLENIALFSTSMDRNMVVWCPNASQGGVWTPLVRVGDVGGALGGSIGGNLLGFVAGCASPDGHSVIGIGYGGSFHCWSRNSVDIAGPEQSGYDILTESRWVPKPFVSGHFDQVTSLSWASVPTTKDSTANQTDDFLLTASADQTCRLYLPVLSNDPVLSSETSTDYLGWKEVCRPLIHGYNLNAVIPRRFGSSQIIVASDEKIIRHFVMSKMVQESLAHLGGIQVRLHPSEAAKCVDQAFIPELGLSNKPKELMNSQEQKEQEARNVSVIDWQGMMRSGETQLSGDQITHSRGLLESQLADYTVWLEVNKWYGHAYDVLCLSQVSRCGRFIASACRAKFAQTQHTPLPKASNYDLGQAGGLGILVWQLPPVLTNDTLLENQPALQHGEIIARLEDGHEMSVVSLEFAPNGRYLASCGKDRSILLHVQENDPVKPGKVTFVSVVAVKNAHKRIIWDASWTADSKYLLTGSRDGALKIWQVVLDADTQSTPVDLRCIYTFSPFSHCASNPSVTAIDVYQYFLGDADEITVVVGSGAGEMRVLRLKIPPTSIADGSTVQDVQISVLCEVPSEHTHTASVRKVMWRRPDGKAEENNFMVWASCSEDHTVRIHKLQL